MLFFRSGHPLAALGGGTSGAPRSMFEQLLEALQSRTPPGGQVANTRREAFDATRPLDVSALASHSDGRAFKVTLEGEGAQDVGGPYREALDNVAAELHAPNLLPLLARAPNWQQLNSLDRDRFILNPACVGPRGTRLLELLGGLIGLTLRTKSPLPFELSGYVWQLLCGETPSLLDLYRVDRDTVNLLVRVRHNADPSCPDLSPDDFDAVYGCITFAYHRSDGAVVPLVPGGAERPLTYATRHEWCDLVEALRRDECAAQLAAVRRGLAAVVPATALALFTAAELERMCCGDADWSVAFLRRNAELKLPSADPRLRWLWEALESFSREERALFLQFTWGRSRMPQGVQKLSQRLIVSDLGRQEGDPNTRLPTASTCFFDLHLPRYTRADALKERLAYAIHNCRGIDLDYVAHDLEAWNG